MLDFAGHLFDFWDVEKKSKFINYNFLDEIEIHDIVKDMMSLGLAPTSDFLVKMLSIVTKKPMVSIMTDRINVKDFQKLCSTNRLVNRILRVLNEHTKQWVNMSHKK